MGNAEGSALAREAAANLAVRGERDAFADAIVAPAAEVADPRLAVLLEKRVLLEVHHQHGARGRQPRWTDLRPTLAPDAGSRRHDQYDAKAEKVGAARGIVFMAHCGAAPPRVVPQPKSAPCHALVAGSWSRRVLQWTGLVVIRIEQVLTPLLHIPVHVVQTPRIRLQSSHRPGMILRVAADPCVIPQLALVVAERPSAL